MEDTNKADQSMPVYCICHSSAVNVFMIMCDFCEEWFHGDCIGVTLSDSEEIDKFCCDRCKKENPALKTTYKPNFDKTTTKLKGKQSVHRKKSTHTKKQKEIGMSEELDQKTLNGNKERLNGSSTTVPRTAILGFVDTTIRKAKSGASEKLKPSSMDRSQNGEKKKSKKKPVEPTQCYGPSCTNASRKGSKYCSEVCGLALATNRILEILPQRINQWTSTPSAADEMSQKKLASIRAQLHEAYLRFQALDIEIIRLINKISQSKQPGNSFVEDHCDDTTPADCMLCGAEIPHKSFIKHLEQCYLRSERKISVTEYTDQPSDIQWHVFCNRRISKNVFCKKMKVLCSLHYKGFRKDDEVCGYNLGERDGVVRYCGNVGRTCNHIHWEQIERAELDLKKLNLLLKINSLKNEEYEIRQAMSNRGDFMSLMLNSTITH